MFHDDSLEPGIVRVRRRQAMVHREVIAADKPFVKIHAVQHAFCKRTGAGEHARLHFPADHDNGNIAGIGEFHGNVQPGGGDEHIPLFPFSDQPGKLNGRRAAIQENGVGILNACIGRPGNGLFFCNSGRLAPVFQLFCQQGGGANRAAPCALDGAFLFHRGQKFPHGDL